MPLPPKPFFRLDEVCQRWSVTVDDVAAYAFAGHLTVSVIVTQQLVETGTFEELEDGRWTRIPDGQEWLTGTPDLIPVDAWSLLTDGHREIGQFRAGGHRYISVIGDEESNRILFHSSSVVVRHEEVERFERAGPGAVGANVVPGPGCPAPRGKPPRYDWDAFWIEMCCRLYHDGVTRTQSEMVGKMLDWFAATGQEPPDESTVKKKVSVLWRQLDSYDERRSA